MLAPSKAEQVVFTDSLWTNVDKMIIAGPGSTMYLEGDVSVNDETVHRLDAQIQNRISVAKGAAVHFPDGSVLETKPVVKK